MNEPKQTCEPASASRVVSTKSSRRGIELLAWLAALVLPGGMVVMCAYWTLKRACAARNTEAILTDHANGN